MIYTLIIFLFGIYFGQEYNSIPSIKYNFIYIYEILTNKEYQEQAYIVFLKIYTIIFIIVKKMSSKKYNEIKKEKVEEKVVVVEEEKIQY